MPPPALESPRTPATPGILAAVTLLSLAASAIVTAPAPRGTGRSTGPILRADARFGRPPLHFEALPQESFQPGSAEVNRQPRFVALSSAAVVSLAAEAVTVQLVAPSIPATSAASQPHHSAVQRHPAFPFPKPHPSRAVQTPEGATIRMTLPGAKAVEPQGVELLPGRTHLFLGNDPTQWRTNLQQFAKVRYEQVYDGIDLVLYGNPDELEYDFAVSAGADPAVIRMAFDGVDRLRVDDEGDLVLETTAGIVRHRRPRAYQTLGGTEHAIAAAYQIDSSNSVRFRVGEYDRGFPLVIDPVLVYATIVGGSNSDLGQAIAVDSEGCVYISGQVASRDFPLTSGFVPPGSPNPENGVVFVTKLDPSGTRILYSTLLGGDDFEIGNDLAVDAEGSAYVVGETQSEDFPVTTRAVQRTKGDGADAYIVKLSPDGATLLYSTFLGGDDIDLANGVAIDASGSAYVTGVTYSEDFPTTAGAYQRDYAAARDVFAAKLSSDGSRLLYSTLIGGSGNDVSNAIAIDTTGNAYLAGLTDARRANGITDAYCVKLDPTGGKVVYAKLFGGLGHEEAWAVAVDAAGNAYLTGITFSKDFPTTPGAFQRQSLSPEFQFGVPIGYDAFVVKLDAQGENLVFSTYLNGSFSARGHAIALDAENNVLVAGLTFSPDFPVTAGALPPPPSEGQFKGFLTKLNAAGSGLVYSTRFGGSNLDEAWGLALDAAGDIYVSGFTASPDFLDSEGVAQPGGRGSLDAFVLKFSLAEPPAVTAAGVVNGASFLNGGVAPGMIVSIFGVGLGARDVVPLELDANGYVKTQLSGTRVLFNDVPAPLVFTSEMQVGAVVPYALDGSGTLRVVVECGGVRSTPVELPAAESAPGLFTLNSSGSGGGAILNQDGSINTPDNPAERGSVVVLFGTGEGQTEPAGQDGKIAAGTLPRPRLPVSVTIAGRPADVLYAGGAPGQVAGVTQVNARVPADLAVTGSAPVVLQIGSGSSQPGVTLAVR